MNECEGKRSGGKKEMPNNVRTIIVNGGPHLLRSHPGHGRRGCRRTSDLKEVYRLQRGERARRRQTSLAASMQERKVWMIFSGRWDKSTGKRRKIPPPWKLGKREPKGLGIQCRLPPSMSE